MTNINEFAEEIKDAISKKLTDADITVINIKKNNDTDLTGLSIKPANCNIAPTIYLNDYYENHMDAKQESIDNIVEDIINVYTKNIDNGIAMGEITDRIHDFEKIKDEIIFKLVNTEKNRDMLTTMPHRDILDLSIIYCIKVETGSNNMASITIKTDLMKSWKNVTENDLYEAAQTNTPRILPANIVEMTDMLSMLGVPNCMIHQDDDVPDTIPMFICTSSSSSGGNGAVTMIYKGQLDRIYDQIGGEFYIIPSSIHETIIIPAKNDIDPEEIKSIIFDVNRDVVAPEEILSDNLYMYDKENGLTITA